MKKQMNKQEMFNKMWLGLSGQGWKRSAREDGACMYRGPGGLKCAVGHLLSDEACSGEVGPDDYGAVVDLPFWFLKYEGLYDELDFLNDAQGAHDEAGVPEEMEDNFRFLAVSYGLDIPDAR